MLQRSIDRLTLHLASIDPPSAAEELWLDIGVAATCVAALAFGIAYFVRNRRR